MTTVTQQPSILGQLPQAESPAEWASRSRKLDYDRGVIIKVGNGGTCAMYVDDPGRYLNEQGVEVSEEEARLAGFDTLKDGAERRRKEARAKAFAEIERTHKAELAAIDAEAALAEPVSESARVTKDVEELAADGERAHPKAGA
jgi:hypothetical protein